MGIKFQNIKYDNLVKTPFNNIDPSKHIINISDFKFEE